MDSQVFTVNPNADPGELFEAAIARLDEARTLLSVQCNATEAHVDLSQHDAITVGGYLGAIETILNEASMLFEAYGRKDTGTPDREKSIALVRDLLTRLYTVDEYLDPKTEKKHKKTRKEAEEAMSGVFDVVDDIERELGISEVPVFAHKAV